MRVEHLALRLRPEKRLVRMLAVDVDQPVACLAQLVDRRRVAVDEGARAAAAVHHAAQEHPVWIALERLFPQPIPEAGQRLDGKFGGDVRALRPGTHLLVSGALTERERQRVDQDGFSGAGLARERGETRPELELEPIDDGKIPNGEVQEHGGGGVKDLAPGQLFRSSCSPEGGRT